MLSSVANSDDGMVAMEENGWKLVQVQVLARHGDRTPRQRLPKLTSGDPRVWSEGLGQLTALGMKQCYELGKAIDARYGRLWGHTYAHNEVKFRASSRDRCIMSATSIAAGVFELGTGPEDGLPGRARPVAVSNSDYWNDVLFTACDRCPELDARRKAFCESTEFKAKEESLQFFFDELEAITGMRPNLRRFYPLFDSLTCLKAHGIYDLQAEHPALWVSAFLRAPPGGKRIAAYSAPFPAASIGRRTEWWNSATGRSTSGSGPTWWATWRVAPLSRPCSSNSSSRCAETRRAARGGDRERRRAVTSRSPVFLAGGEETHRVRRPRLHHALVRRAAGAGG